MSQNSASVRVHVNIEISAASLQAVVANTKQKAGADSRGRYQIDTADALSALISRFLWERDFDAFAGDPTNY